MLLYENIVETHLFILKCTIFNFIDAFLKGVHRFFFYIHPLFSVLISTSFYLWKKQASMRIYILGILLFLAFACGDTATSPTTKAPQTSPEKIVKKENPPKERKKSIIFFGDSITAHYGLEEEQGYTAHIQKRIDSLDLNYKVVNAGLSGETTAGGLGRINWILKQPVDVFVLELGGNDALRGVPTEESYKNLLEIADRVQKKYPEAQLIVAGMEAPPNMGKDYVRAFRANFAKVAKEKNALLIPFLLENVGGIPELNQADGIHPTAKGHQILAENVWKVLKDVLK